MHESVTIVSKLLCCVRFHSKPTQHMQTLARATARESERQRATASDGERRRAPRERATASDSERQRATASDGERPGGRARRDK